MSRLTRLLPLLALVVTSGPLASAGEVAPDATPPKAPGVEREDLSILYAGYPGGPREKAWTGFLRKWFSKVEAIDLRKLSPESAHDFDVVVADWTSRYKDGRYDTDAPRHGASLREDFTKPIIMISAVGAELTRSMALKTDWL